MILDINTLLIITVANIVVLAVVAPAVMGRHLGPAANAARGSLISHAASWVFMIASNYWPETWIDHTLSTLSMAGFAGTNWLMYHALEGWLGPRPWRRVMGIVALIAPLGYALLFPSYALRVGWANFLLMIQLLILTRACFLPAGLLTGRWRFVVAFAMASMAVLTSGRGFLGAFTDLYPSFLTPHPWNMAAMLMTTLAPTLVYFAILGGWHEEAENALHRQAVTDSLTGLYNRRGWQEVAQPMLANARRHGLPLSLLMVDIDFFKRINDTHGHDAGDQALRALSRLLGSARRSSDVAARIGGEEFCLLLPGSDPEAARAVDERLREKLPDLEKELGYPLNFSTGLARLEANESLENLMIRADAALYAAKAAGRGRLHTA